MFYFCCLEQHNFHRVMLMHKICLSYHHFLSNNVVQFTAPQGTSDDEYCIADASMSLESDNTPASICIH